MISGALRSASSAAVLERDLEPYEASDNGSAVE
jgi:hypothetical protein